MKKLLGIVALTAVATAAFAQGTVQFSNVTSTGPIQKWTSTSDSTLVVVAKSVGTTTINARVELLSFYNSTSASLSPLFTPTAGGVMLANASYSTLGAFLSQNSGWAAGPTTALGTLQNGAFNGGVLTLGSANPAANVMFAVVGWTGNYASYDLAYAANLAVPGSSFMGLSSVFSIKAGDPTASPPGTPGAMNTVFTGMGPEGLAPVIVPEPASFALAGLGLAALLAFRRRS